MIVLINIKVEECKSHVLIRTLSYFSKQKAYYIRNPLYEDEVKWLIKTNDFDICIHFNVPLFSSLYTILLEEKPFNSGYHVVVDNKI